MPPYNYSAESLNVQARLLNFGLTPDRLMLIGAFIVAYGMFETTLERALWTLTETDVNGVRPFTEKMDSKAQFKRLGEGNSKLSAKCNAILKVAAHAAEDLNEYRNSLVHGYLLSFGRDSTPSFMKNPGWHGVKRNKLVGDAYIDEPVQDLVLTAAWTLIRLVRHVEKSLTEPESQRTIEALKDDVLRAKNSAGEARHLRSLMNHEKYQTGKVFAAVSSMYAERPLPCSAAVRHGSHAAPFELEKTLTKSELITQANNALRSYETALGRADAEKAEDYAYVMGRANLVIEAFSLDDIAETNLAIYAFSRTVSDVYSLQPPEYKELSSAIHRIGRYLKGKTD